MNKFILIKVSKNIERFLKKCKSYNIDLHDLDYINKEEIIVKINKKELEKIIKYNYYSEITIYKKLGLEKIKEKIFELKYFILLFIILLTLMYTISNIIFKVEVIHSNKKIRELVTNELIDYGIKDYSFKKKFNELEDIKNKILNNNKDKLEWISITNIGMKVIVRVEERIIDKKEEKNNYCNIISVKDALITSIYGEDGEIIVEVNDIVKKNDILISGNIKLNEENKGYICASGKVMGKVWYTTNISVKRDYEKKKFTGNSRINISFNNRVLRNIKYNKFEKKYLIKNKYFSIYKELEYNLISYKYNEKESIEKVTKELSNKFKSKLGNEGKIIDSKILSKNINDNMIDVRFFVTTEENISKQLVLNIIEEQKN